MNVINSKVEKVDEKMRSFVQFLCFFPELWPLICPEKCIFYNFAPKVLTTLFQKMIWFIVVSTTLYEILATKISKNTLTQQKFNKII